MAISPRFKAKSFLIGMSQGFPGFLPNIFCSIGGEMRFLGDLAAPICAIAQSRDHSVADTSTLFLIGLRLGRNISYVHCGAQIAATG
jgi:hypothetical protein